MAFWFSLFVGSTEGKYSKKLPSDIGLRIQNLNGVLSLCVNEVFFYSTPIQMVILKKPFNK